MISCLLALLAGVLTFFSPSVLPILPFFLCLTVTRSLRAGLILAFGFIVSFATVNVVVAANGDFLGFSALQIRVVCSASFLVAGAAKFVPSINYKAIFARTITSLFLGILLGLVWTPCSGPTLGLAVGLAAHGDQIKQSALLFACFATGASLPLLAVSYYVCDALERKGRLQALRHHAERLLALLMLLIGLILLLKLDKTVEGLFLDYSPRWLVWLSTKY